MQIRTPAVAGMFYPKEKEKLELVIRECFSHSLGPKDSYPSENFEKIYGVICPHAGYMYSGPIASHSYHAISSAPIELAIIIGPNHWGLGCNIATIKDTWKTPLGLVEVDSESVTELCQILEIVEIDSFSHTREHSIEVQIPMLQEIFSKFKILPISMINQDYESAKKLGNAVAKISQKKKSIIIGSSDFTHYEESDFARKQDEALIDPILELDIDRFYQVLNEKKVSACGYGAIASTMVACQSLGATKGKLLKYANSGDITKDKSSVVGYAAIVFT